MSQNDSVDADLEKELQEDLEAKNPELLDETVFNKFATGELDLPESDADDGNDQDNDQDLLSDDAGEDSELEAYYEELGIDVAEMHEKRQKKQGEAVYKKQKKTEKRKEKVEAAKRERNQILDAMM